MLQDKAPAPAILVSNIMRGKPEQRNSSPEEGKCSSENDAIEAQDEDIISDSEK